MEFVAYKATVFYPLEEELIYDDSPIEPDVLSNENPIEKQLKQKVYRRDMQVSDKAKEGLDEKEYVIPNSFQQHKRNVAFSASLSKQKLLLKSDYDIPPYKHLKTFIASLDTGADMKIFTGFFILNIVLGCRIQDLVSLLQEKKEGSFRLKDSIVTVELDTSIFAENHSKLLFLSEDKLSFNIPISMQMLIAYTKRTFLKKDFDKEDFLEKYKQFIKDSIKEFPKKINLKWKYLYRCLAQYAQENEKDILTAKFATAVYSQNDTAKLAYASSRTNATEHSQLIKEYWNKLNLDQAVSNILDIPNIFASDISSMISRPFYAGTSQAIKTNEARTFFEIIRQNIYDYQHISKDLYFNLTSIYIRYAMSLLAGTRTFKESANFSSYNEKTAIWMVSEKAQDIASGTRLVPLCNIMNQLLVYYKKLLVQRNLENNFYLIVNGQYTLFSSYEAHKFIQNTQELKNQKVLEEYIKNVPLNTGRHLFTKKAIDALTNIYYISTYLGHFSAGEEQFGIYSTLNISDYFEAIISITSQIANECGIKEL
jgi:hypothetical protein